MPPTQDQVARAREILTGASADLQDQFASFLQTNPTRGQMNEYIGKLRASVGEEQLKLKIETICRVAGIERPTGADRLMAMQIGLLQEQNAILQEGQTRALNQMRSDAQAAAKADSQRNQFSAILGGVLAYGVYSHL